MQTTRQTNLYNFREKRCVRSCRPWSTAPTLVRLPLLRLHREVQDDVVLVLDDDAADQTGHLGQIVILSLGGETWNNGDTDGLGKLVHFSVLTEWTGEDRRSSSRHGIHTRTGQSSLVVNIKVEILLTSGLPTKWSRVFVPIRIRLEVEELLIMRLY